MRKWFSIVALALTMSQQVLAADVPPPPNGDRAQQAQYYVDLGYAAYQREEWSKAIALYLESYKAVPSPDVLFNIAVIYERKLGNKAQALEYYQRHNAATDARPELVAKATARIDELSREASSPKVTTPTPAVTATAPAPAASKGSAKTGLLIGGIASSALGLAGLGVGAGFGVSAIGKMDAAKAEGCAQGACPDAASAALVRGAFADGNVATIGFVAGGVLVAAGITFFALSASSDAPATAIHLTPTFGRDSGGFALSGSF
ncbi:MAG: tetratricopeptide repeat protein [Myxococcota bacterium]